MTNLEKFKFQLFAPTPLVVVFAQWRGRKFVHREVEGRQIYAMSSQLWWELQNDALSERYDTRLNKHEIVFEAQYQCREFVFWKADTFMFVQHELEPTFDMNVIRLAICEPPEEV